MRGAGLVLVLSVAAAAQDTDGDGLSDFHEIHKYLTDPSKADSDGDGVPDGDWRERREYQYVVRSVVQVMRPVTIEYLCDDYQDARVLDETDSCIELEVFHYPFSTAEAAIEADPDWRRKAASMEPWTRPGVTADWTPAMRDALVAELECGVLDDRALVERASKRLLERAAYHDGFTTFVTAFDAKGDPILPDGSRPEQAWQRELSARGMFENRCRGSCSSTAIYLNGCLRALGVPTRIILVIPVVDANDDGEMRLLRLGLRHHGVRRTLLGALRRLRGSWTSHTFNEVFVGGRWRRLNYDRLGQPCFDRRLFGLSTHVATFSDWADARMAETIGKRQALARKDDVFGGPNPYSAISLRDEFGPHCRIGNPAPEPLTARIAALLPHDDPALPQEVRDWFERRGTKGFVARVEGPGDSDALAEFLAAADLVLLLDGGGATATVDSGCWWWRGDHALVRVAGDLPAGAVPAVAARNQSAEALWTLAQK